MSKKLSGNVDFFEDYHMLAIVSNLKDYTLCYHVNNELKFCLAKYEDLIFEFASDSEKNFSYYFFEDKRNRTSYYLIGNKSEGSMLLPAQKTTDYFLLIKDPFSIDSIKTNANLLRKNAYISAVFDVNMQQLKGLDLLLETIELHELEFIKKK